MANTINRVLLSIATFYALAMVFVDGEACVCTPSVKSFNETLIANVRKNCVNCFSFLYDFHENQTWTPKICISSRDASIENPLFITVSEYNNIQSFQLPVLFPHVEPYLEMCRTLCPLSNYEDFNSSIPAKQFVNVEIRTNSDSSINYNFVMYQITDFLINTGESRQVTITPSKPYVMQYNLDETSQEVLIEAASETKSCMVLAIQNTRCPIFDYEQAIDNTDFFQSLTLRSGITIPRNTFKQDQVYIILYMKATDKECMEDGEYFLNSTTRSKEVMLTIVSAISDYEYYVSVIGLPIFYAFFIIIALTCYCCLKKLCPNLCGNKKKHDAKNTSYRTSMLYVSELSRQDPYIVIKKTQAYTWNILIVSFFYAIPVIQLVYKSQSIVNITGNQDLCYYNFLCSYRLWWFSDFNHLYSNLGYLVLGLTFIGMVKQRKATYNKEIVMLHTESHGLMIPKSDVENHVIETTGLIEPFGILYAMGGALFMQGILSATYHICPNGANFQFDTTFMCVIGGLSVLKLLHSRRPDMTPSVHKVFLIIAVAVIMCFGGVTMNTVVLGWIFTFVHLSITCYLSINFYFIKPLPNDRSAFKAAWRKIKEDFCSRSNKMGHQVLFFCLIVGNIAFDIYLLITQPEDFATRLLYLILGNALVFLLYYYVIKVTFEGTTCCSVIYVLFVLALWAGAIHFFTKSHAKWELTPALSREHNENCAILFFDNHDIWHILSSIAVFVSYVWLLGIDNDLMEKPRTEILVF